MSFPTKKFQTDTPLHLAAEGALGKLIQIFLEHGGNPNTANGRGETCLHSVCHRPENARLRLEVMDRLLLWRSIIAEDGDTIESVSINHVDIDGNAAVHYASSNGLLECVERLISLGAIISIVNKAQKTCCELADGDSHTELARMLELALVFQPIDSAMIEFDNEESLYFENQTRLPLLALDCNSFPIEDLSILIDDMLMDFTELSGESFNRSESLLEAYSWDAAKLKKEYGRNMSACYKLAQIQSTSVDPFEMDRGPWIPESNILKKMDDDSSNYIEKNNSEKNDIVNQKNIKIIHSYPEEGASKNVPKNDDFALKVDEEFPMCVSVDSLQLDFKSTAENEKVIEKEKKDKKDKNGKYDDRENWTEKEIPTSGQSNLLNHVSSSNSDSKSRRKDERRKAKEMKNASVHDNQDLDLKRNKKEKKIIDINRFETRQSEMNHPVFTSNPCSICGEMMLRPVSASNALLTRAAEKRRDKGKMKGNGRAIEKDRDREGGRGREGEKGGNFSNGDKDLKGSDINSDIDGTQIPSINININNNSNININNSNSDSRIPTTSSSSHSHFSPSSSSSSSFTSVYQSPSSSLTPSFHNYSGQQAKSQTQNPFQNQHQIQYEHQSGDVPDLDQRAIQCLSGHSFCLACWSAYVSLQVLTLLTSLLPTIYRFLFSYLDTVFIYFNS